MRWLRLDSRFRPTLRTVVFWSSLLIVLIFTVPAAVVSSDSSSTVDGSFQVLSDNGPTRHIEFHATRRFDGSVFGETTFRDDTVDKQDKNDEGDESSTQPFFFKANFDCLVINTNNAVMSGAITEASSKRYVGRRVLVVAQDNGGSTDSAKADRLTWGIYQNAQRQWLASDAERSADEVSPLSWIATDSERADDEGTLSNNETVIGCQSFPLSSFAFLNKKQGRGTVRVRP